MADKQRGSRGKRGSPTRESRSKLSSRKMVVWDPELRCYVEVKDSHDISTAVLAERAAILWDCAEDVDETVEDHIVPRVSLSRKQWLKFRSPVVDRTIQVAQIATKGEHTGKKIGEDTKVISMIGETTLLNKGIPFRRVTDPYTGEVEQSILERQTSRSKKTYHDTDTIFNNRKKSNALRVKGLIKG